MSQVPENYPHSAERYAADVQRATECLSHLCDRHEARRLAESRTGARVDHEIAFGNLTVVFGDVFGRRITIDRRERRVFIEDVERADGEWEILPNGEYVAHCVPSETVAGYLRARDGEGRMPA